MHYRKKIEQAYNIKLNSDFVVHHIDFNRNNNELDNLMILPKKLHQQYHFITGCLTKNKSLETYEKKIDIRITSNYYMSNRYQFYLLKKFYEIFQECSKWLDYKYYLEGILPNIHNIKLEEK